MHAMVLGFAGYGLLLSSSIALAYLLRIGCLKEAIKSPLHIFSTSDTLISVLTSMILLVNQSFPSFDFVQEPLIAGPSKITDRQLLSHHEDKEDNQNLTCMRIDIRETDGSTPNCTFQHVLMHYAIFLIPFANAFVSLLIYSVQCSSGVTCITKKCLKLTNMSKNLEIGATNDLDSASNSRTRDTNGLKDVDEICKDPEAGMSDRKEQANVSTISNKGHLLGSLKKKLKFTCFGLTMQWLVPVLVTAIMYFSKTQDMNDARETSEMDCIFKVNFPLESCLQIGLFQPADQINQKKNNGLSVGYSGVKDSDTLRIPHLDSNEIDEVVSKVRNLVQSALNKTCYNGTKLKSRRDFKPWNITRYYMQQMKNHGIKIFEKLTYRSLGISENENCTSMNGNDSNSDDTEAFEHVSHDIVKTSELIHKVGEAEPLNLNSVELTTDIDNATKTIEIINRTTAGVHEVSSEDEQVNIELENKTKKLNDEIETEIIKQIRDLVGQAEAREDMGNQLELNSAKFNSSLFDEPSRINGTQTSLLRLEGSGAREDKKTAKNVFFNPKVDRQLQDSNNKNLDCFLSATFLRIHLLIFLFSVYFLPVLISAVLQTRSVYMCKNMYEKIESANKKLSRDPSITRQPFDSSRTALDKNSPKSGWFSGDIDGVKIISTESLSTRQNFEDVESPDINSRLQEDRKTGYKNVLEEMRSMQMLFAILKKSLLLSMLMWTPAFLEILSKVFLCTSSPAWLANGLYLLGISFGIVKNFINMSIAKIDKNISDQIHRKDNSIYPSSQH